MEFIKSLMSFLLQLDSHLFTMIQDYGVWIYVILFLIIFIETGIVLMPFLPGDSLLFVAGTFCAGVINNVGDKADLYSKRCKFPHPDVEKIGISKSIRYSVQS
jgi:membrane-associated protein